MNHKGETLAVDSGLAPFHQEPLWVTYSHFFFPSQCHLHLFPAPQGSTPLGIYFRWDGCKNESESVRCSVMSVLFKFCDPIDYSPPGSSIHGILQARILEWVTSLLLSPIYAIKTTLPSPIHAIKTTRRYHLTSTRLAIIQKTGK